MSWFMTKSYDFLYNSFTIVYIIHDLRQSRKFFSIPIPDQKPVFIQKSSSIVYAAHQYLFQNSRLMGKIGGL